MREIAIIANKQTMTSLEIAEVTGKSHFDVLKAIRKMEPAWEKVHGSKFACLLRTSDLPKTRRDINKEVDVAVYT